MQLFQLAIFWVLLRVAQKWVSPFACALFRCLCAPNRILGVPVLLPLGVPVLPRAPILRPYSALRDGLTELPDSRLTVYALAKTQSILFLRLWD